MILVVIVGMIAVMILVMIEGMLAVMILVVRVVMFFVMRIVVIVGMLLVVRVVVLLVVRVVVILVVRVVVILVVRVVVILVMRVVVLFVLRLVRALVLGLAMRSVLLAAAERHPAERHNQTKAYDRYENAAYHGHDIPLVWGGLLETFPIFVPTKMRLSPFAPRPIRWRQPASNIDYASAARRGALEKRRRGIGQPPAGCAASAGRAV
jgi:hypothetical protein